LRPAVGDTVGAADESQFDIPLATLIAQQRLVITLGHEDGIEALLSQAFADHIPRAEHTYPRQLAVMRTELAGVFARDVVLIGVVLEDDQIGNGADETGLTNFLLEAKEEHNTVVLRDVDVLTEVPTQVALLVRAQPAQIAVALFGDAFV
jgi:hypothetical protein